MVKKGLVGCRKRDIKENGKPGCRKRGIEKMGNERCRKRDITENVAVEYWGNLKKMAIKG